MPFVYHNHNKQRFKIIIKVNDSHGNVIIYHAQFLSV